MVLTEQRRSRKGNVQNNGHLGKNSVLGCQAAVVKPPQKPSTAKGLGTTPSEIQEERKGELSQLSTVLLDFRH